MTRSMTAQAIVRRLVSPREAADHLGAPLDFLPRQLQQLGRAEPLAEPEGIGQVDRERRQVAGKAGRGRGELGAELTDGRWPSGEPAASGARS